MPTPLDLFRDRLPGLTFGGDYNPEQWTADVWKEDVRLMREANVGLVSLGVFAWSVLEPTDGTFDFGWLDEVMDLLHANNIAVNLATPNGSPPPWLATDFPETLMVNRDQIRVGIGSRGHFCPSSPVYRDRSRRIAQALAERYRTHPALVMWHVGNEYHAECFCELCDHEFRNWLQHRYGTLEALNQAWGTTFWSQQYSDWDQVRVPQPVRGRTNPARDLDFSRFNSDNQLALYTAERDLLRTITPHIPITTNYLQYFPLNDYHRWSGEVDVVAYDSYPDPAQPDAFSDAALMYDLMRSLRGGQPWMLMEQAAASVSQWKLNVIKKPGLMRLGSYQAIARGADAIMYFQWRASRYGQEKFHSAMLPHSGEHSRSFQEVLALGNEIAALDDLAGATSTADVAIVWDWENWWAVEGCYHPDHTYSYRDAVTRHYRTLWNQNIATDVVTLDDDLSRYRVVIIPNQYAISDRQRDNLRGYVANGGQALISYFSGIVDEHDRIHPDGYPGALRELVGAWIQEFSPLPADETVPIDGSPDSPLTGLTGTVTRWQDDLVVESAQVLASYTTGWLTGRAAVTDNRHGNGHVVYIGAHLDEPTLARVVQYVLDRAAVRPTLSTPAGIEVTERRNDHGRHLFILNHTDEPATVTLDRAGTDNLTGKHHQPGTTLTLAPLGVTILTSPPT